MVWAIVVFAVVALEGQVDFEPAPLTLQTSRLLGLLGIMIPSSF
jgi:hypothetical protein